MRSAAVAPFICIVAGMHRRRFVCWREPDGRCLDGNHVWRGPPTACSRHPASARLRSCLRTHSSWLSRTSRARAAHLPARASASAVLLADDPTRPATTQIAQGAAAAGIRTSTGAVGGRAHRGQRHPHRSARRCRTGGRRRITAARKRHASDRSRARCIALGQKAHSGPDATERGLMAELFATYERVARSGCEFEIEHDVAQEDPSASIRRSAVFEDYIKGLLRGDPGDGDRLV